MANVRAIHSVGNSLITSLRNAYPTELSAEHACAFRMLASGELAGSADFGTTLSLYLYRITINEHLRGVRRTDSPSDAAAPLGLDLHYLMTVWADNALTEQIILAWAMRQMHLHQCLSLSDLSPDAGWRADEAIQLVPVDISTEDLMRIWDALDPPYHISVGYVARVVRLDVDSPGSGRPVVATRFTMAAGDAP